MVRSQMSVFRSRLLHMTFSRAVRRFLAGAPAILPAVIAVAVVLWVADFLQNWSGRAR